MTLTSSPPTTRPARRVLRTVLLWVLLLPGAAWAVVRFGGWERGALVQLFAFTPYVAAWAVVPALLAFAARRWLTATVATVAAALLIACVLPRSMADRDPGPQTGVTMHVLTGNMLMGKADPATIVRLVRENDVAVLALQEYTGAARSALTAAGLDQLLPYSSLALPVSTDPFDTTGSALYSRYPITAPGVRHNRGGFQQAYGTIQPPGARPVVVESAHPMAPYAVDVLDRWRSDLEAQPYAEASGPVRILMGDFNSTLDHKALRSVISHGYRDAADATGQGLIGTWGPYADHPLPPVTIDHVLVDERIGVADVSVHGLPRSDHRAVLADLRLPTP
ncbi:endonuclease/exonuclease/phosphatase family protein [Krasilnikovia sp. MM14-A1004]|uniref:endonuclease/exonuclease/phosphatase family protein n=1 Tax=Krasilnikovia sp. MM14-A1004 TaxID=3373541 RepID=UPI00399CAF96